MEVGQQHLFGWRDLSSAIAYPGGKSKAVAKIVRHFPPNLKEMGLLSPFFGGGSVELSQLGLGVEVAGADKFRPLVRFWQDAISDPNLLADRVRSYYPVHDVYEFRRLQRLLRASIRGEKDEDEAALFFVISHASFSGTTLSGGFSPPKEDGSTKFTLNAIERLRNLDLAGLTMMESDFKDTLLKVAHCRRFVFLDPPYPLPTENLYGDGGDLHRNFPHGELQEMLMERENWLLCYNDKPIIRELYQDCEIIPLTWTQTMGDNREGKEVLIRPRGQK